MTQTLDYYPYGSQRIATGSFSEQRRFIGEEYDGDTAFSYLNARYYDPNLARFISPDPLFDQTRPQSLNPYSYGHNNPTTNSDQHRDGNTLLYTDTCTTTRLHPTGMCERTSGDRST